MRWRLLVLALPLVLLASIQAADARPADERWWVDYDAGLRAIDRSDWEGAIVQLQSAIRKNPKSSANARTYGMRFITYVPYFYLGVARYNLRDTAGTLEAFREERAQGEIAKSADLAGQLAVLERAARGPEAPAAVIASANASQGERLAHAVELGEAALARGEHRQAYVIAAAVLAIDPRHGRARKLQEDARARALAGELAEIHVAARAVAGGDSSAPAAPRSESDILESKAWELVRRGSSLLERGFPDSALSKLDLALTLAEDLPKVTQLVAEARRFRTAADREVKRLAESRRQLEIAAAAGPAAPSGPSIALVTPVANEEESSGELVTVQGTVIDPRGVERLEIEVNGQRSGGVNPGQKTRGVVVSAGTRGGPAPDSATRVRAQNPDGTIVDFYRDVALTQPVNRIVIRAHSVGGGTVEAVRIVRRNASPPRVWAVIVGVAKYRRPGVPALQYTVADAEAFANYLAGAGVPREQVITLYDDSATTPRITSALGTDLHRKAGKGDLVLIFFAGHGAPETDAVNPDGDGFEKYLLSIESSLDDLFGSALSMGALGRVFDRIPADRLVFIADACYSGAAGGRTIPTAKHVAVSDRFLGRVAVPGKGRVILAASSANELSQERSDLGHGVFTYYFLEALRGKGDANADGLVTVDEVYRYVSMHVPEATGQLQHPVLKGDDITSDLVLGRLKRP